MKVGWAASYFEPIGSLGGGAEIADSIWIRGGEELGFQVSKLEEKDSFSGFDLLIVSNIRTFSKETIDHLVKEKFVYINHDIGGFEHRSLLLEKSILNIFLSPLHKSLFKDDGKSIIVPNPFLIENYYSGIKIKNSCVYAGVVGKYKGHDNVVEYAKQHLDMNFEIIGIHRDITPCSLPNVKYTEKYLSQKELIKKLSIAEYFIHLPQYIEAFGRTVAEAFLCGCKLICNDQVGFLSFPWSNDIKLVKEKLGNSRQDFWKEIERVI